MNPIWKDVEGYEGFYQVSSTGQVRSVDRVVDHKRHGNMIRKGKMLKPGKDTGGYPIVNICKNGKCKNVKVHRLVAMAFAYNPERKPEVNHLSGIKTENGIWNLEFVTGSENVRHAYQMGLFTGKKILTNDQVDQIRSEYIRGNKHANHDALAKKYDVSITTINCVLRYKGRYAKQGI